MSQTGYPALKWVEEQPQIKTRHDRERVKGRLIEDRLTEQEALYKELRLVKAKLLPADEREALYKRRHAVKANIEYLKNRPERLVKMRIRRERVRAGKADAKRPLEERAENNEESAESGEDSSEGKMAASVLGPVVRLDTRDPPLGIASKMSQKEKIQLLGEAKAMQTFALLAEAKAKAREVRREGRLARKADTADVTDELRKKARPGEIDELVGRVVMTKPDTNPAHMRAGTLIDEEVSRFRAELAELSLVNTKLLTSEEKREIRNRRDRLRKMISYRLNREETLQRSREKREAQKEAQAQEALAAFKCLFPSN